MNKIYRTPLTFLKASLLAFSLLFMVTQSEPVYAVQNPSIDEVKAWRASGDTASFYYWVINFDQAERNQLWIWFIYAIYQPFYWDFIEDFIDANGGSGGGSSGGGAGDDDDGEGPEGGLKLSKAPLFLSTAVEPNIHFIIDDSGSMFWETMIGNEITEYTPKDGKPIIAGSERAYYHPYLSNDNYVIPPISVAANAWMAKNSVASPSYYDPTKLYEPWPGLDTDGSALFTNANPTAAKDIPYTSSDTVDLTATVTFNDLNPGSQTMYLPVFYRWNDSDFDGVIEASDAYDEIEIKPGNEALFFTGRSYTEELQNFANWFQYYRKREFAAKVAIGSVINNTSGSRMGLDFINEGHVKDVKSMSDNDNKVALLKRLYSFYPSGGTPLRNALKTSGEMFKNSTTNGPILTNSEGGACQQNFQVLMTDGYRNGSTPSNIGNADGNNNTAFDGGNYADTYSATLADVAMYYYENDLSALNDEVPTTVDVDEAAHQHLVTYTIAFGLKGTIDPATNDPDSGNVVWPQPTSVPVSMSPTLIDDVWHAAYNGRGEYLNAAYPEQLEQSLDDIISNIAERAATAAAVAVNSAKLTTETVLYLAEFNTYRWQGEIYAYKIADLNTGELEDTPKWKAGEILSDATKTDPDDRIIITYDGTKGVAFRWDDISATHKNDLDTTPAGATSSAAEAEALLNYLRGERVNEGNNYSFRVRSSLLGDVVNSGPVYVGKPNLNWPDFAPFPTGDKKYSDFKVAQQDREGVIYAGSNDGMLHAFSETTGKELLAYIPNILYSTETTSGLHYLSNPNYIHQYYVDLTPSISDVFFNNQWHTILIGGLRGGGKGIFALNVTDPSIYKEDNAESIVMWEFTDGDDSDLGRTYSEPQIALANNGKWVAVFGNGYNNLGSGESALFIVDIVAGLDGTWSAGDYIKIKTGAGSTSDINGLSSPALADLDGDGTVDRVYAGDLQGKMWAFDLSSSSSASWALASATPLFTTKGDMAITGEPALASHPKQATTVSNSPNLLLLFGSGKYLEKSDRTDTSDNYFYGVWDKGTSNLTDANLVEQAFDATYTGRVLTQNAVDYTSDYGWFIGLPESGERAITKPVVRFKSVFFNTFVPQNSGCLGGGYGYKMAVDLLTGGALDNPEFDVNDDYIIDDNDYVSNGSSTSTISGVKQEGYLPEPVFVEDLSFTADQATKVSSDLDIKSGRLSWQELLR